LQLPELRHAHRNEHIGICRGANGAVDRSGHRPNDHIVDPLIADYCSDIQQQ
jgi:hypothetical protein